MREELLIAANHWPFVTVYMDKDWEDGTVVVWHDGGDGAVSRMADVCCCSYCCLISVV